MAHNVCCDSYHVYKMTYIYYTIVLILGSSMWRMLACYILGPLFGLLVVGLAWRWLFRSKHVALIYAFSVELCWLKYIIKWISNIQKFDTLEHTVVSYCVKRANNENRIFYCKISPLFIVLNKLSPIISNTCITVEQSVVSVCVKRRWNKERNASGLHYKLCESGACLHGVPRNSFLLCSAE